MYKASEVVRDGYGEPFWVAVSMALDVSGAVEDLYGIVTELLECDDREFAILVVPDGGPSEVGLVRGHLEAAIEGRL